MRTAYQGTSAQPVDLTLASKWDLWHALKARGQRPKVQALPKTA
jgi:hypothetical protein